MMKNKISVNLFNLKYTFESGQPITFYGDYDTIKRRLVYTPDNTQINLKTEENTENTTITFSGINRPSSQPRSEIIKRFRLKDDLERMYDAINTDEHMANAIHEYNGMRITLNEPWETILCFITSQFNSLKRIRIIMKNLIYTFGAPIYDVNNKLLYYAFPQPERISEAKIEELMACGAGFRSKYIIEAATYCNNTLNLDKIRNLNYFELKEELMSIHGIGDKVADCIALMGYGKLEAFPIDVWVKRCVEKLYFKNENISIKKIHKFAEDKWGEFAGLAQQYVFWYGRNIIGR